MAYLYQLDQFETKPQTFSHLYYCYRKVFDPRVINQLMLIENLHYQMIKTAWFYKDCDIAKQKLIWWHEELKNSSLKQAKHPITQKLQQLELNQRVYDLLLGLNEAALGWLIYEDDIKDSVSLIKTITPYFIILEKLKADALGVMLSDRLSQLFATLVAIDHYIYFFPELIKRDLLLPDKAYLTEFNLNIEMLKSYQSSPELGNFLGLLSDLCIDNNQEIKKILSSKNKKKLRPLLTNIAIWQKLIKKTRKDHFDLFHYQIQLSPLQMLFC